MPTWACAPATNNMRQNKTIYLVLFLIFILILIVILQISNPDETESPPIKTQQFNITSSNITNRLLNVSEVIKIKFSMPVKNQSLSLQINPNIEVRSSFDRNLSELTIEPFKAWRFDTIYIIRVSKTTMSSDGQNLDKNYEFTFKTTPLSGI